MTTAIFTYGKESLADWFARNPDCECMIIEGEVYGDLDVEKQCKKGIKESRYKVGTGWHQYDLLYGFEQLLKNTPIREFDITNMHLLDYDGKVDDNDIPCEAADYRQPSPVMKMLVNRKYGTRFVREGNLLLSTDRHTLVHYFNAGSEVVVPNGITNIGRLVFAGIMSDVSVVLPDGLLSIDEYAFDGSEGLKEINFPEGLKTLGVCSFSCTGLTSVVLPDSIEEIPACCFLYNDIERLHLSRRLKAIREAAFFGIRCSTIYIPKNVEVIESEAFVGYCERIHIPKSCEVARDYYYEAMFDDGSSDKPRIIWY